MSATRLGRLIVGLMFSVLGALNLAWGDFSYVWTPAPKGLPWRETLADASGVMLILLGLGLLIPRLAKISALVLTVNCIAWMLLVRLQVVLAAPRTEVHYEELGETMILTAGAWCLMVAASRGGRIWQSWLDGPMGLRIARWVLALALPGIGISHFFYAKFTAQMIPGWIPFHTMFVYLTGIGHIAAGLGLLFGVLPRLAATAEAAMISIFAVFSNLPLLLPRTQSHEMWVELLSAIIMAGACWAVAGSFEGEPWGLASPRSPSRAATTADRSPVPS